jgi:hypothetical protein
MAAFPNINASAIMDQAWAPGAIPFGSAIKFWQQQLKRNRAGGGLQQLAGAAAANPAGAAYQQPQYMGDPTSGTAQEAALGPFSGLQSGLSKSRSTRRDVGNKVTQADLQGGIDVGNAFGQSVTDNLEGNIALNKAQEAQAGNTIGGLTSLMGQLFGGPFGQAALSSLIGGSGGGGAASGLGGLFGSGGGPFSLLGPGGAGSFGSALGPFSLLGA